ncbi:MAG: right-handed parallel beta-helix repeat-containing protein, partial [Nanoarchaeota archaeon]|nr:right-handed parallel beta-helix repeat-containing protein [Nanoarchaeota archaeon]
MSSKHYKKGHGSKDPEIKRINQELRDLGQERVYLNKESVKSVLSLFVVFVIFSMFFFMKIPVQAGSMALDEAQVFTGKDAYSVGEMAHIFVVPSEAEYNIEVYDPDNNLAAISTDLPVEKTGIYSVNAVLSLNDELKEVSTTFKGVVEADNESDENISLPYDPDEINDSNNFSVNPDNFSVNLSENNTTGNLSNLSLEELLQARKKADSKLSLGMLKKLDLEFSKHDMKETIKVIKNRQKDSVVMEKDGLSLTLVGTTSDKIKNASYKDGVLHIDSLDIETASISIPHEELSGITKAPKLYVREDNQSDYSLAVPYEKDGNTFNSVFVTPTHYEFDVEHFTDYYVNSSGTVYLNLTGCLLDINGSVGDSCIINDDGLWGLNKSYIFNITPAANSGVITIISDNVTLDCNETYLFGDNTDLTYGIYASNVKNLTLFDCNVGYFERGIYLLGAINTTILNSTISNNKAFGVYLRDSDHNTFKNNSFNDNGDYALYLDNSDQNNITYNLFNSVAPLYDDMRITSGTSSSNRIWLNSFYGNGIYDAGTGTSFCIANKGNFYEENIIYSGE